tara:strand:- start:2770 stop:3687 length:918 start_codon:yes stop_codon:yes gene_type:complete
MNLYKINKEYSLVLFFFTLIVLGGVILNLTYEIPFLKIICFFLISTIGISHGALDNLKGYKILKFYGINKKYFFYLTYIIFLLLVIFFWILFPSLTLSLFLLVAAYHFGKEDCSFGIKIKKRFINLFYLLKGSIVILAPLAFHPDETIAIFEILNVKLNDITNENWFISLFVLSFLSNFFIVIWGKNDGFIIADWFTIIMLNVAFSPLVAFTIYFCFLHSVRHSLSLIYELNKNNFNKGFKEFIKKALPLTIITGILYLIAVFILTNSYDLDNAILKVIFIGLASLTFPHILLEYLVEKNGKKRN